jgi:hypothetical protein
MNTGEVQVLLLKTVGTTETNLANKVVSGLTYSAGDVLHVRLQVMGTGSTALRLKVWKGNTEPTAWTLTANDSTASLQAAGGVGLGAYVSGSATNLPITFSFDDLLVPGA